MRKNIFVDFDNSLVNSLKSYCEYYKKFYGGNPNWRKVKRYDLSDECPLVAPEDINKIFSSREFFDYLELMPFAYEAIKLLNNKFTITICSIGTFQNLSHKSLWIERNLPFIKNAILIRNENCSMDKSIVDMGGGIILDDVAENLKTSNAKIKVLVDNNFEWNINSKFDFKSYDWYEIYEYLMAL